MSYYIPAKTSVKVVQSNPDYYFIKYKPVTRKSDNLYRKIRLEFEREFTKGIWIE